MTAVRYAGAFVVDVLRLAGCVADLPHTPEGLVRKAATRARIPKEKIMNIQNDETFIDRAGNTRLVSDPAGPPVDRPEDIANRKFYNHLPTRHVTVTYECDVACDENVSVGQGDSYLFSLLNADGMTGNLRVRNPTFVSATVADEVRHLDTLGNEVEPLSPEGGGA